MLTPVKYFIHSAQAESFVKTYNSLNGLFEMGTVMHSNLTINILSQASNTIRHLIYTYTETLAHASHSYKGILIPCTSREHFLLIEDLAFYWYNIAIKHVWGWWPDNSYWLGVSAVVQVFNCAGYCKTIKEEVLILLHHFDALLSDRTHVIRKQRNQSLSCPCRTVHRELLLFWDPEPSCSSEPHNFFNKAMSV